MKKSYSFIPLNEPNGCESKRTANDSEQSGYLIVRSGSPRKYDRKFNHFVSIEPNEYESTMNGCNKDITGERPTK